MELSINWLAAITIGITLAVLTVTLIVSALAQIPYASPTDEYPNAKEIASLIKIPACPACELYPARCPTCEKPVCEKPRFQEIAENLASEENYRDKYNCEDFSKELIRRLKGAGYRAKYCTGTALWCDPKESEFSCRHAWVRIDGLYVEATNGGILTPEQFKEGYKVARCG